MTTPGILVRNATLGILLTTACALPAHAGGSMEIEVAAQVENGPLAGALVLPASGPVRAAMVVIPGSGPTDRNGDNPLGVDAGYLRMLAAALAEQGIASIRVDKRGMFASKGRFGDANAVTFDDYAGDALAWVEVAKERTGAGCVWLAGHSEGGLVALLAAQAASPSLCGLVLVAAPGRPMGTVLRAQLGANPANAPLLDDALDAIAALERGERVDVSGFHPALRAMFAPTVQGFLIDAFARDPAALAAGLALPVLIVDGDEDIQVTRADADALFGALSGTPATAERVTVPGMNHVLKQVAKADIAANLAAYGDPSLPLAPGLAEAIGDFVLRRR